MSCVFNTLDFFDESSFFGDDDILQQSTTNSEAIQPAIISNPSLSSTLPHQQEEQLLPSSPILVAQQPLQPLHPNHNSAQLNQDFPNTNKPILLQLKPLPKFTPLSRHIGNKIDHHDIPTTPQSLPQQDEVPPPLLSLREELTTIHSEFIKFRQHHIRTKHKHQTIINSLQSQILTLESSTNQLQNEKDLLATNFPTLQSQYDDIQQQHQSLTTQHTNFVRTKDEIQKQLLQIQTEQFSLLHQYDFLKTENSTLLLLNNQLHEQLQAKSFEYASIQDQNSSLQAETQQLQHLPTQEALEYRIQSQIQTIDEQSNQIAILQAELDSKRTTINELESHIQQLELYQVHNQQHVATIQQLQDDLTSTNHQLTSFQSLNDTIQNQLTQSRLDNKNLLQQLTTSTTNYITLQRNYEHEHELSQSQYNQLNHQSQLNVQLQQKVELITNLERTINELTASNSELSQTNTALLSTLQTLQQQLTNAQDQNVQAEQINNVALIGHLNLLEQNSNDIKSLEDGLSSAQQIFNSVHVQQEILQTFYLNQQKRFNSFYVKICNYIRRQCAIRSKTSSSRSKRLNHRKKTKSSQSLHDLYQSTVQKLQNVSDQYNTLLDAHNSLLSTTISTLNHQEVVVFNPSNQEAGFTVKTRHDYEIRSDDDDDDDAIIAMNNHFAQLDQEFGFNTDDDVTHNTNGGNDPDHLIHYVVDLQGQILTLQANNADLVERYNVLISHNNNIVQQLEHYQRLDQEEQKSRQQQTPPQHTLTQSQLSPSLDLPINLQSSYEVLANDYKILVDSLQGQITSLHNQLDEKTAEIELIQARITQKDDQIHELSEQQLVFLQHQNNTLSHEQQSNTLSEQSNTLSECSKSLELGQISQKSTELFQQQHVPISVYLELQTAFTDLQAQYTPLLEQYNQLIQSHSIQHTTQHGDVTQQHEPLPETSPMDPLSDNIPDDATTQEQKQIVESNYMISLIQLLHSFQSVQTQFASQPDFVALLQATSTEGQLNQTLGLLQGQTQVELTNQSIQLLQTQEQYNEFVLQYNQLLEAYNQVSAQLQSMNDYITVQIPHRMHQLETELQNQHDITSTLTQQLLQRNSEHKIQLQESIETNTAMSLSTPTTSPSNKTPKPTIFDEEYYFADPCQNHECSTDDMNSTFNNDHNHTIINSYEPNNKEAISLLEQTIDELLERLKFAEQLLLQYLALDIPLITPETATQLVNCSTSTTSILSPYHESNVSIQQHHAVIEANQHRLFVEIGKSKNDSCVVVSINRRLIHAIAGAIGVVACVSVLSGGL